MSVAVFPKHPGFTAIETAPRMSQSGEIVRSGRKPFHLLPWLGIVTARGLPERTVPMIVEAATELSDRFQCVCCCGLSGPKETSGVLKTTKGLIVLTEDKEGSVPLDPVQLRTIVIASALRIPVFFQGVINESLPPEVKISGEVITIGSPGSGQFDLSIVEERLGE